MLTSRREIRIEWGDCDPLGIVYFPRYFEFFDACTVALFERAGLRKHEMMEKYHIAGIPLVEARSRFFATSTYGDVVVVESNVTEWGKSSFGVHHRLFKGDVLAVEGFEKRVWVVHPSGDAKKIQSQEIPREIRERFEGE
jgi:4-hydroxybenzoyl-CoA thioesterase